MKKVILSLIGVAFMLTSFAQRGDNQGHLTKIEKSNAEINDPKKNVKSSTWLNRGKTYYDAAIANSSQIFPGLDEAQLVMLIGKPGKDGEVSIEKINNVEYRLLDYPGATIYVTGGKVAFWIEKKPVVEGALDIASEAYFKAMEMDPKAKDKALLGIKDVINSYVTEGNAYYTINDYSKASKAFSNAAKLAENPSVNSPELTTYLYYSAISSIQNNDYSQALPSLEKLKEKNYEADGDLYTYLASAYNATGDRAKAEQMYIEGANKFPSNQKVIQQLISFYISGGDDPVKVIPFIKKAQEADPNDKVMVLVEGIAYQNMKDYAKAHQVYDKVKAMDPTFFDVFFNDGLIYIAETDIKLNELNAIDATNANAWNAKYNESVTSLKEAVKCFESAHKIDPKNKDAVEMLKNCYFRLRDTDPVMMENYNKYNEIFKTM